MRSSVPQNCWVVCFSFSLSRIHLSFHAPPQDLPGALSEAQVSESLELHAIKNRPWAIHRTSAIKGEGLFEGLDW